MLEQQNVRILMLMNNGIILLQWIDVLFSFPSVKAESLNQKPILEIPLHTFFVEWMPGDLLETISMGLQPELSSRKQGRLLPTSTLGIQGIVATVVVP